MDPKNPRDVAEALRRLLGTGGLTRVQFIYHYHHAHDNPESFTRYCHKTRRFNEGSENHRLGEVLIAMWERVEERNP